MTRPDAFHQLALAPYPLSDRCSCVLSRLVSQAASALHALSTTHAAWLFLCNASELAVCVNARSMYCLILGFLIVIVGLLLKYPLVFS